MSEAECPVRPGDVVAGKYRVDRTLGSGGMGVVVAATQIELDRWVALKFLLPKVLERPRLVARFSREARAAASLQSEHVARVIDVGALEGGEPYIVMEYLEGEDLSHVLARRGPLPCDEAVGYVLEACEAVAEAHAHGIVHRDLKPANLFLATRATGAPVIKVLDFGLSKFAGEENVTSASTLLGSPLYMSPEQLWSATAADARSDIWSLGVVLYELLTAHAPFLADGMPELIATILHKAPRPIENERPEVPAGLRAAVHRCLEKEPSLRFADTGELAKALAEFGPPWAGRCVERVSHVLDAGAATAPGERAQPVGFAKTLPAITPSRAAIAAQSVAGSSRTIRPSVPGSTTLVSGQPSRSRAVRPWLFGAIGALTIGAAAGVVRLPRRAPAGGAQSGERPSPTSPASGWKARLESTEPQETTEAHVADTAPPAPSPTILASPEPSIPKRTPKKIPKLASSGGDAPPAVTAPPSASPRESPLNRLKAM